MIALHWYTLFSLIAGTASLSIVVTAAFMTRRSQSKPRPTYPPKLIRFRRKDDLAAFTHHSVN